ncbi:hypothetical protein CHLNCDRAFT_141719 [Chlorella variabilis]|uniref:OTU domain-containing protein n=1 Tax=Chlorella variabilis TaxID=554065 RepID=E1ZTG2_CHLVA|nr:hypothetical protein CHLNCDRAFT_141719 [Chlorella variabilis]EFN50896.1 hypothetical protein CHLNCDRAFT_141719 [Chlorella variabilis]|eukprot:XP_005842998.1 hypothetical protein CHLNCDRAFT_141719 [Chlorella variabilis]
MGKKGGKAFLKSARAARAEVDDSEEARQAVPEAAALTAAAGSPQPQPAFSAKAAAFLKDGAAADDASSNDDEEPGAETRGKMLQRHKREQKALKDQMKRLGKEGKDEGAKLEAEMEARHAAELASLAGDREKTVAEAVAVADSLYSVHLGDEEQGEQQHKKASKGQRRREQRQREEQEREARIQAELAELGDTDRVIEQRELKAILRPLGLVIREIPPDGHCLYRSLEDQLQQLPAEVAPPPTAEGEQDADELNFLLLRQKVAEHMRQHAEEFKPFVLPEDLASGGGDDLFEAYCTELETTAAWGGQVELQALAQVLKSHIAVYTVGMPVQDLGEEYKESGRTLRLCYLRHAYGLGEHYESVVPGVADDEEQTDEDDAAANDEE